MPIVRVRDIDIYYEVHGAGPPLVVIGGLALDVSEYGAFLPPLAAHATVIVFDNRGAGRTSKPPGPYYIEQMADDAAALMEYLHLDQADVLGISMGGRIALALTLRYPDKVSRLVLVSTSARVRPRRRRTRLVLGFSRLPGLRSAYPQPRYALDAQFAASSRFDATTRLAEIRVPTLILHGMRDRTTPYPLAQEMHARISGSTLETFNGGHLFMFLRERDRFAAAVVAFLKR
ncbi:MAG TPA: alpha/beta hydrolase [Acidothermaceae bacterium]|jgi:pimeloyl-ACP methyl ester carboxylesterase|nr:alpha/beta hydrolase [Acidothermaceae bacterium]